MSQPISPEPKRLYIETVGCQMNVLDSEMVVAALRKDGYVLTQDPAQADAVLFNTCSVREHAEEKAYNNVFRLKQLKLANPDMVIGVMGCMAQKDQQKVFDRVPFVDLVVGPGQLHRIPELIEGARQGERHQLAVSLSRREGSAEEIKRSHETFDPLRDPQMRPTPFQAYLRIQIGCDKFCTYCIVPMTRGPEQGRAPEQILQEAKILAQQGAKEITLLGQTVNSYKWVDGDRTTRLADLLEMLHPIEGLERIKFVTNYPNAYVMMLLIDERPEEVTDMQREVRGPKCEVISSTFDEPASRHIQVSQMVLEKAKRMVEDGIDVIVFLDSITRLARAWNGECIQSGKTLTGGLDANAMQKPKAFFGAARKVEEGGSLTIIATALVGTGSRMDEVIFEEFKGTGNMEIVLDRALVDRRIWPAVDIYQSGTRREEALLDPIEYQKIVLMRKALAGLSASDAMEQLVNRLQKTRNNPEFLLGLKA